MNELYLTNVLLIIIVVCIALLTIALIVATFFLIKILKNISGISNAAQDEVKQIVEDTKEVRSFVKKEAMNLVSNVNQKAQEKTNEASKAPYVAIAVMGITALSKLFKKK